MRGASLRTVASVPGVALVAAVSVLALGVPAAAVPQGLGAVPGAPQGSAQGWAQAPAATPGHVQAASEEGPVRAASAEVTSMQGVSMQGAVTAPAPAARSTVAWRPCGGGIQCATMRVPLDHKNPRRGTIDLAVTRLPATDARRRVGSLFVNPGGPGIPSSLYLSEFADIVGPQVTARFDLIGVDPRGVGGSQPFTCSVPSGGYGIPQVTQAYPMTAAETRLHLARDAYLRRACSRPNVSIQSYMSTADSARDLDVVRRALGERTLSFYGLSYGSYLGLTYANLFPGNVRAVVLDGVLDPINWSTGRSGNGLRVPVSSRTGSAIASWAAWRRILTACGNAPTSSCAPGAAAAAEWTAITTRLRRGPFRYQGERLSLQDVILAAQDQLYDTTTVSELMGDLHALYRAMNPSATRRPAASAARADRSPAPGAPGQPTGRDVRAAIGAIRESAARAATRPTPWATPVLGAAGASTRLDMSMVGVMCSDTVNPLRPPRGPGWPAARTRRHRGSVPCGPGTPRCARDGGPPHRTCTAARSPGPRPTACC